MLIARDQSSLLVVDVQEKLAPAVSGRERVIRNAAILMKGAAQLGVPVLVSEQYPRGLGHTVAELAGLAPADAILAKTHFSCAAAPEFRLRLEGLFASGRGQVVICGMETHVCVLQTALLMKEGGFAPVVVADAASSRTQANHEAGLARLVENGVEVATTEMVLFEWLRRAATHEFREILGLIK
jgi:nicotinamidase-related amidase